MKRLLPLALLVLVAARIPEPGPVDPHIQSVLYSPDEVVQLRGALGWQIMLEFGADERIENVSIGDALAWQVTPNKRARNLFLKPLIKNATTNMTVVTDKRRYAFSLETTPRLRTTPWVVRFDYPRVWSRRSRSRCRLRPRRSISHTACRATPVCCRRGCGTTV